MGWNFFLDQIEKISMGKKNMSRFVVGVDFIRMASLSEEIQQKSFDRKNDDLTIENQPMEKWKLQKIKSCVHVSHFLVDELLFLFLARETIGLLAMNKINSDLFSGKTKRSTLDDDICIY